MHGCDSSNRPKQMTKFNKLLYASVQKKKSYTAENRKQTKKKDEIMTVQGRTGFPNKFLCRDGLMIRSWETKGDSLLGTESAGSTKNLPAPKKATCSCLTWWKFTSIRLSSELVKATMGLLLFQCNLADKKTRTGAVVMNLLKEITSGCEVLYWVEQFTTIITCYILYCYNLL